VGFPIGSWLVQHLKDRIQVEHHYHQKCISGVQPIQFKRFIAQEQLEGSIQQMLSIGLQYHRWRYSWSHQHRRHSIELGPFDMASSSVIKSHPLVRQLAEFG